MANEKKCKLNVAHATSKKGNDYYGLILDTGFSRTYLSCNAELCATVLGISPYDLPAVVPLDTSKEVVSWVNK